MIVFTKQEKRVSPAGYFSQMEYLLERLDASPRHEYCVELLMEWGELESGISDRLFAESDCIEQIAVSSREIATLIGRALYLSWEGLFKKLRALLPDIGKKIRKFSSLPLPRKIRTRVPEGYIYYGLYPEMYIEAARAFFKEIRPERAVSIGLRSIGTSLSAAVSGTLTELGVKVESFTLRPRGHPFRRKMLIAPDLEEKFKSLTNHYFLIIDEGPGISGSSFGSTARALSEMGIPDAKIIFFPSHIPEGKSLVTPEARENWQRYRKYLVSFEDEGLSGKVLGQLFYITGGAGRQWLDISAGNWRSLFYEKESEYPALHPNHEQRKYLCLEEPLNGKKIRGPAYLMKFAGLGKYGRAKYERGMALSGEGLYPRLHGTGNGFLMRDFVEGRPVAQGDISRDLIDYVARYIATTGKMFQAAEKIPFDPNMKMISENVLETIGKEWSANIGKLEKLRPVITGGAVSAIDGRMMRHEWLVTPGGFLKTDSVAHHIDQFYPRNQDPAWDVAAVTVEFPLKGEEREYLLARYAELAGDPHIGKKLSFYRIAYLAYRLGYTELASLELGSHPDGLRLKSLSDYYAFLLKMELSRLANL